MTRFPLSLRGVDLASVRDATDRESAMAGATANAARMPSVWARICVEALSSDRPVMHWASDSTLLCAAPGSIGLDNARHEALLAGQSRGASMPAPIYPATPDRTDLHTSYRDWFAHAAQLDAGALHALAVCNPGRAAQLGAVAVPSDVTVAYDETIRALTVRASAQAVELDVEVLCSLAIMEGLYPEEAIGLAVAHAREQSQRLASLSGYVERQFGARLLGTGAECIQFARDGFAISDPLGSLYVASGIWPDRYDERLAAAIANGPGTRCTCEHPREVRAIARPSSELLSFEEGQHPGASVYRAIDAKHALIFELECPHATARPTAAEWEPRGLDESSLERAWLDRALPDHVLLARSRSSRGKAVLVYDEEIASIGVVTEAVSALARALSFAVGERLSAYSPNANLLFLTDEPIGGSRAALRRVLSTGPLLPALEAEGLPAGPPIALVAEFAVLPVAPKPVEARALIVDAVRDGSFV